VTGQGQLLQLLLASPYLNQLLTLVAHKDHRKQRNRRINLEGKKGFKSSAKNNIQETGSEECLILDHRKQRNRRINLEGKKGFMSSAKNDIQVTGSEVSYQRSETGGERCF
jgi:hypothetical protein